MLYTDGKLMKDKHVHADYVEIDVDVIDIFHSILNWQIYHHDHKTICEWIS